MASNVVRRSSSGLLSETVRSEGDRCAKKRKVHDVESTTKAGKLKPPSRNRFALERCESFSPVKKARTVVCRTDEQVVSETQVESPKRSKARMQVQQVTRKDETPPECSMCGDMGLVEELHRCCKCSFRFQHTYCSNSYPRKGSFPPVCNWCDVEEINPSARQVPEGKVGELEVKTTASTHPSALISGVELLLTACTQFVESPKKDTSPDTQKQLGAAGTHSETLGLDGIVKGKGRETHPQEVTKPQQILEPGKPKLGFVNRWQRCKDAKLPRSPSSKRLGRFRCLSDVLRC